MRERELRAAATCLLCQRPFGQSGLPLFYRVRVERWGLLVDAIRRQDGLTTVLGGHAGLAAVMGPDDPMAATLSSVEFTVCEGCSTAKEHAVAVLSEIALERAAVEDQVAR